MIGRIFKWGLAIIESLIGLILVALFVSFIVTQRNELEHLGEIVTNTRFEYLGLGILLTISYIFAQGQSYRLGLRAVHKEIPLAVSISLFLKRFFLGSFLPAGFTVSQYTYAKDVKRYKIEELESHLASSLYLLIGGVAYVVILVPTVMYLLWSNQLTVSEGYGSIAVMSIMLLAIIEFLLLLRHKGVTYHFAKWFMPDLPNFLGAWKNKSIDQKQLVSLFFTSLVINGLGILTLLVTFMAFNIPPSFKLATIGFVIMILVATISPLFQGLGLVEVSLVYVLKQFGLSNQSAVAVTLLYRFFLLWMPFLLGLILVLLTKLQKRQAR